MRHAITANRCAAPRSTPGGKEHEATRIGQPNVNATSSIPALVFAASKMGRGELFRTARVLAGRVESGRGDGHSSLAIRGLGANAFKR